MIGASLERIKASVRRAQRAAGVGETEPSIIAVSKGQSLDRITDLISCGHAIFGENRVQEGIAKFRDLRHTTIGLNLHLIGPLQTNKVRHAVAHFDVIQSLDRPSLAEELAREMSKQNRCLQCFIQVNTGHEPQKAGVDPDYLENLYVLSSKLGLDVVGLMCVPPVSANPEEHFSLLARLQREFELPYLSIGMSADYEIAVANGATHVRIGTALFGHRNPA